MGRKPLPESQRRSFLIVAKFKPEVKSQIDATINRWIESHPPKPGRNGKPTKRLTYSQFVRMAVWEMCKLPNDPREP